MTSTAKPTLASHDSAICILDAAECATKHDVPGAPDDIGSTESRVLSTTQHSESLHAGAGIAAHYQDRSITVVDNLVEFALTSNYDEHRPPTRYITKKRALEIISSLTGAFQKSATVCMHIDNEITYPLIYFGILASASTWTGTNTAYTTRELAHHFRTSNTSQIVVDARRARTVADAIDLAGMQIEMIIFSDLLMPKDQVLTHVFRGCRTLHDIVLQTPGQIKPVIDPRATCALFSTSGTSGAPKMSARTHEALVAEAMAVYDNDNLKPYNVRRLFCTPIFHAFSAPLMLINPIKHGQPTYLMRRYDDSFASRVFQYGITETAGVPTFLKRLSDLPMPQKSLLQSLRTIWCAGGRLGDNTLSRFLSCFAVEPRVVQVWGMSEGGWFSSFKYPEIDTSGSVGRPLPGFEVKLESHYSMLDPNGHVIDTGELLVKSQQLMANYMGNIGATEEAFDEEGYMRTGDVGYQNSDGKIFLVDRAKDLIKVNGWQVSPSELQDVLAGCPLVQDAAVVGCGPIGEEFAVAFVVPSGPETMLTKVKEYLSSQCATYKVSGLRVMLIGEIPKNSIGKVDKRTLKLLL
ncbi:Putative AMP-dependent synthetase/ligase, AMP-binding enzyme domain, ANL domain-containing protein [Septoria linicola]|uniref:AMP-dependent synthetase/ligase, AMP-binding enzyme domain, ANL domain-containing protein n=1 Tax=Septoria linicola TaxID=215465 RepID=A0A9Q9AKR2_9PEZI|nr:Putative AMP-dependent synthetase/ligase, AMP-binding enzyme domain, ANL domain-containing protein [Septoria linicola]